MADCDTVYHFADELTDGHILSLAERITSKMKLLKLGRHVLKIPDFTVQAALAAEEQIQEAAYEVLSEWRERQRTGQEAYTALHARLEEANMTELAAEMEKWVSEPVKKRRRIDSTSPALQPRGPASLSCKFGISACCHLHDVLWC